MSRLFINSGSLKLLESLGPVQDCTGIALPLLSWLQVGLWIYQMCDVPEAQIPLFRRNILKCPPTVSHWFLDGSLNFVQLNGNWLFIILWDLLHRYVQNVQRQVAKLFSEPICINIYTMTQVKQKWIQVSANKGSEIKKKTVIFRKRVIVVYASGVCVCISCACLSNSYNKTK